MLKPFGHVISTRILRDANGLSRGVGFARYVYGFGKLSYFQSAFTSYKHQFSTTIRHLTQAAQGLVLFPAHVCNYSIIHSIRMNLYRSSLQKLFSNLRPSNRIGKENRMGEKKEHQRVAEEGSFSLGRAACCGRHVCTSQQQDSDDLCIQYNIANVRGVKMSKAM